MNKHFEAVRQAISKALDRSEFGGSDGVLDSRRHMRECRDAAWAYRQEVEAENARLQRVVDELAHFVRRVNAREHLQGFVARQSLQNDARKVLEKHGLLRPCDDPAQVPSAMRAEVE